VFIFISIHNGFHIEMNVVLLLDLTAKDGFSTIYIGLVDQDIRLQYTNVLLYMLSIETFACFTLKLKNSQKGHQLIEHVFNLMKKYFLEYYFISLCLLRPTFATSPQHFLLVSGRHWAAVISREITHNNVESFGRDLLLLFFGRGI